VGEGEGRSKNTHPLFRGPMKKPFSLTYVTYDEGDTVGFLAAGITLAPIFIMVMYASLILFRREFHTIAMLLGQVRIYPLIRALLFDSNSCI
jgi:hypothetical protein